MSLDQNPYRRFVMAMAALVEKQAEHKALCDAGGAQEDADYLIRQCVFLTERAADQLKAAIKESP